jgi:putative transposase
VNICAYALMSNHYHRVVRLDPELARGWSDQEVMARGLLMNTTHVVACKA